MGNYCVTSKGRQIRERVTVKQFGGLLRQGRRQIRERVAVKQFGGCSDRGGLEALQAKARH